MVQFPTSSKKQNTKKDFLSLWSFDRLSFVDSLARARGRCAAETGRALHVRSPPAQHAACPATFQPASTASCPRTAACCNAVRSPAKPTSHPTHAQLHIHERRASRAACSRRAARVPHSDPSKVKTRASPAPSSPLPSPSLRQAPDATSAGCCIGIGRALCPAEHVERRVHDPAAQPARCASPSARVRAVRRRAGAVLLARSPAARLPVSLAGSHWRSPCPSAQVLADAAGVLRSHPGLDGDDEGCPRCRSERRTTAFRVARWVVFIGWSRLSRHCVHGSCVAVYRSLGCASVCSCWSAWARDRLWGIIISMSRLLYSTCRQYVFL